MGVWCSLLRGLYEKEGVGNHQEWAGGAEEEEDGVGPSRSLAPCPLQMTDKHFAELISLASLGDEQLARCSDAFKSLREGEGWLPGFPARPQCPLPTLLLCSLCLPSSVTPPSPVLPSCPHRVTSTCNPPCPTPQPPRQSLPTSPRLPPALRQPCAGPQPTVHQSVPCVPITQALRARPRPWSSLPKGHSFSLAPTEGRAR